MDSFDSRLGSAHLLPGSIRSIPDKDGVRIDGGVSDWENEIEELLEQRAGNDLPPPMSPTSPTAPKSLLFRPPKSPKSPKSPLRIRVPASLSPKSANDALQPVTPTEKTRSSPDDKESPRARGIDRSTLWFDAEDVIMIVDGKALESALELTPQISTTHDDIFAPSSSHSAKSWRLAMGRKHCRCMSKRILI